MAYRVLSTKKLLPNQKLYLLNAGLAVIEADFIGIRYKPFSLQHTNPNLIFTSQNAFKSFLLNEGTLGCKDRDIVCVGSVTKGIIEKNGFTVVAYADTAEMLAEIIVNDYPGESFTFFSGSMRRDTLPDALAKAGIDYNEIEVYETALTPQKITSKLDGILFFSPSGIESYLSVNAITDEACFCIGATTAAALKGITDKIVLANMPSVENVIVQVRGYFGQV